MRYVVDTNTAVVANGRPDKANGSQPYCPTCVSKAAHFLRDVLARGTVLMDLARDIQGEYRKHLNSSGQPGVGDRFYQVMLSHAPGRVEVVDLPKRADGSFEDFPSCPDLAAFDPSDRKFAALARRENVPVACACETDWLNHEVPLKDNGIRVQFLCGTDPTTWFTR